MRRFALAMVVWASVSGAAEEPRIIVVDPGHGGTQEGAQGPAGVVEKELALQIAQLLQARLEKTVNAKVFLTRDRDQVLPLSDRVTWSNKQHPDLFISIHANSMPTRRQRERTEGIETFFLSAYASGDEARKTADRENSENPQATVTAQSDTLSYILADLQRAESHVDSSRLAYAVHQRLIATTGAVDRGVQQAPFYVLMGVEAPAILVEVGFISHPQEGKKLGEGKYQQKLATAIADGVQGFFEQIRGRDTVGQAP